MMMEELPLLRTATPSPITVARKSRAADRAPSIRGQSGILASERPWPWRSVSGRPDTTNTTVKHRTRQCTQYNTWPRVCFIHVIAAVCNVHIMFKPCLNYVFQSTFCFCKCLNEDGRQKRRKEERKTEKQNYNKSRRTQKQAWSKSHDGHLQFHTKYCKPKYTWWSSLFSLVL